MNETMIKNILNLYGSSLFREGFLDFFLKMQKDGIESARRFWDVNPRKANFPTDMPELFEEMISFYSSLGFVSKKQYDDVVRENNELKKENEFLKDTIKQLNLKVFAEGSTKVQESWTSVIEKQMDMSQEIAKGVLDVFKQSGRKKS
jgi:regulator of replication initiation timing